jgi:hypothetical protein
MNRSILLLLALVGCGGDPFEAGELGRPDTDADVESAAGDDASDTGQHTAADAGHADSGADSGASQPDSGSGAQDAAHEDSGDSASPLADSGGTPDSSSAVDACTPLVHSNGIGQTYLDCAPLGTYNVTTATEACAAWAATWGGSASSCSSASCGVGSEGATDGQGHWANWAYESGNAGHVLLSTVDGCDLSSTPTWN